MQQRKTTNKTTKTRRKGVKKIGRLQRLFFFRLSDHFILFFYFAVGALVSMFITTPSLVFVY